MVVAVWGGAIVYQWVVGFVMGGFEPYEAVVINNAD